MSACACLGPQNGDPVCPCRMRSSRGPFVYSAVSLIVEQDADPAIWPALVKEMVAWPVLPEQPCHNEPEPPL